MRTVALVATLTVVGIGAMSMRAAGVPAAPGPPPLVWPLPPDPARIRFERTLERAEDVERNRSLFSRVADWVTGARSRRMLQPSGITVDSGSRLYVADPAARLVHVFDAGRGRYTTLRGPKPGGFRFPVGVAADDRGRTFVTDAERAEVLGFDGRGKLVFTIADSLQRPAGIAFHAATRRLYVTDALLDQVRAYDLAGRRVLAFGIRGAGPGQFHAPTNIAIDPDGQLVVTDALNARVQTFSPEGRFTTQFGRAGDAVGDLPRPKGVAVDSEGHIYVVEGLHDVVNIFDSRGRLLLCFGNAGRRAGEFWLASGLCIDREDRIYVADSYNGRVQVFQYLKVAGPER